MYPLVIGGFYRSGPTSWTQTSITALFGNVWVHHFVHFHFSMLRLGYPAVHLVILIAPDQAQAVLGTYTLATAGSGLVQLRESLCAPTYT